MKNKYIKFITTITMILLIALSNNTVVAQSTITCPSGDKYKCNSTKNKDGSTTTVFKGRGKVIIR